jgi:hypothetical protein
MRTKTLLLAAALSAAGLATSLAQSNVYSLNVVGYINIPTTNAGFYLLANQLDFDGTGVNNTIETSFGTGQGGTTYPNGTRLFAFNKLTGLWVQDLFNAGAWVVGGGKDFVNANGVQPGQGVFYQKVAGGPDQITFVGNVLQGALVNTPYVGLNVTSSKVPQSGGVISVLGLSMPSDAIVPLQNVTRHKSWVNAGGGDYLQSVYANGAWPSGEPNIFVGEAFFLRAHTNSTWTRNFTVQ